MLKRLFSSKFVFMLLIASIILAVIVSKGGIAKNEPEVLEVSRMYPIVDLSATLQERISVMRFGPTDASRIYGYSLWAADVAFRESKGDHKVIASAGAYVANHLVDSTVMSNEMQAFKDRHGVIANSAEDEKGNEIGKKIIEKAEQDGYATNSGELALNQKFQALPKDYQWVPTGTGDGALDPAFANLYPLVEEVNNCTLNIPTVDTVNKEGIAMYKSFDPKNAVGLDVLWWLAGTGTSTPTGYWLRITNFLIKDQAIEEAKASELIGKVAMADFDAAIMLWKFKYGVNLLRPETLWKNLYGAPVNKLPRDTPNHPSFPSGHSGFSSSAGNIIIRMLGNVPLRDQLPPDLYAKAWTREWPSVTAAIQESSMSRINAGFHYPIDTAAGEMLGRCIADRVDKGYAEISSEVVK